MTYLSHIRKYIPELLLLFVLISGKCRAQIFINEFSASNSSVITDPYFGEYADWLELYNAGNSAVNLIGYYITDNIENPDKWQIAQNTIIPAGSYLIIWADGQDTGLHTSFKLAIEGESIGLFSPDLELIDSITYSSGYTDISYGRCTDASAGWGYFAEPTPGNSNSSFCYEGMVTHIPEFSVTGGLFESPVTVEIISYFGGTIRYTLDGSDPDETSLSYQVPIPVDSTTVVRARLFEPDMIPGRIVTHTYFINEDAGAGNLPVFSLATDPENFWDPVTGIYVQDFKPEWEVPVNIELFENNGSDRAAFNELAGTKVNGLYSWQLPQKMLGIYFKKKYGSSRIDYPLIFDRKRTNYNDFALRASGNDWSNTLFRDAMIQNSTPYNMTIDIQGFRPSVVYVNGEYLGIHNIREKVDANYIEGNYGLAEGTFDMVENEEFPESGNLIAYDEFLEILDNDLSVESNFDAVASVMDIENFTDYIVAEVYSQNYSIDHNVMAWKPNGSGKWKWILMDLDRGFFHPDNNMINFYIERNVWPLRDLLENDNYRMFLGKKLADHLYTTFNPMKMIDLIDYHQQLIEAEMPNHIARWLGTTSSYGDAIPSMDYWINEVILMKTFADARPYNLLSDLMNYGFSSAANLNLAVYPNEAGLLEFNGLKIPESQWCGAYPQNQEVTLTAIDKPGFNFTGWSLPARTTIIPKKSFWKYLDDGSDQGVSWYQPGFDDNVWASGQAELGYGDNDEQTLINYGSSSNSKFTTTYFRKTFTVTADQKTALYYIINLKRDDGAIVYLNGERIISSNLNYNGCNYTTQAMSSANNSNENQFIAYLVDGTLLHIGGNTLAVEVHQSSPASNDLGFDLEFVAYSPDISNIVTTNRNLVMNHTRDTMLVAVFSSTGECIIPEIIKEDLTLSKDCSPYMAQGDVTINENVTLTIEPGVEIYMPPGASIIVHGNIIAEGTSEERIFFRTHPDYGEESWGALCFKNTSDTSIMDYVTIEDASQGPVPITDMAAISAFNSSLYLNHLNLENVDYNPIAARYSDITLLNSVLHSKVIGDLINNKYGKGRIENCEFRGNNQPDTDGIDYDNITNGIIKNCKVYDFQGFNSDAIDIGEKAFNVQIDSVFICNITDKGISVGQFSTVTVQNSIIVNCNLGLGLKDSSYTVIDHCTFYGTGIPVSCYEKNQGSAGGNAYVTNSILSNSYDTSYYADHESSLQIAYSISDNDELPDQMNNLFDNPLFVNPTLFNFHLNTESPCISGGFNSEMGSLFYGYNGTPSLMISDIFYNLQNNPEVSEFFTLYNPSSDNLDISGYRVSDGIEFTFPDGTILPGTSKIYLVQDLTRIFTDLFPGEILQWTSGNLANEGEILQIKDRFGIIRDQVRYDDAAPWPSVAADTENVLSLIDPSLDNHFAESWTLIPYYQIIPENPSTEMLSFYPNPATETVHITTNGTAGGFVKFYSITGDLIDEIRLDASGKADQNINPYPDGILIVKYGNASRKLVVIK